MLPEEIQKRMDEITVLLGDLDVRTRRTQWMMRTSAEDVEICDYKCRLTREQLNAWHERVYDLPAYGRYLQAEADWDTATQVTTDLQHMPDLASAMRGALVRVSASKQALFLLAKAYAAECAAVNEKAMAVS